MKLDEESIPGCRLDRAAFGCFSPRPSSQLPPALPLFSVGCPGQCPPVREAGRLSEWAPAWKLFAQTAWCMSPKETHISPAAIHAACCHLLALLLPLPASTRVTFYWIAIHNCFPAQKVLTPNPRDTWASISTFFNFGLIPCCRHRLSCCERMWSLTY